MSQRVYHQDYIARIRYSNVLPPPPIPPKLLNIPGTGLGDGQYTSAAYASRLAREQPLNIEVDAELGMPIDLVGMPGVFDGDESCIQSLDEPPPVHPDDKPLLRPANSLGRTSATSGASFLRRSEMLSATSMARPVDMSRRKPQPNGATPRKKQKLDNGASDDPARIALDIEKSFFLANQTSEPASDALKPSQAALTHWNKPEHPENPGLTVLDAYPVLPDLDATPDLGSYTIAKFQSDPLGGASNRYDTRLDVAIIRPKDPPQERIDDYNLRKAAFDADPSQPDPGQPAFDYDLYLPADEAHVADIKAQVARDADAAANGADDDDDAREPRQFNHIRMYETYQQAGDLADPFGDTLAIALHDPAASQGRRLARGAYVYPIAQRTYIRPSRGHQVSRFAQPDDEQKIDAIDLLLRPANDDELALRSKAKAMYAPAAAAAAVEA